MKLVEDISPPGNGLHQGQFYLILSEKEDFSPSRTIPRSSHFLSGLGNEQFPLFSFLSLPPSKERFKEGLFRPCVSLPSPERVRHGFFFDAPTSYSSSFRKAWLQDHADEVDELLLLPFFPWKEQRFIR